MARAYPNSQIIILSCISNVFQDQCFIGLQRKIMVWQLACVQKLLYPTMRDINIDRHMEYSESFVKEHIDKWVSAWNNHDLKTVLSMYSNDIEFTSPKIKILYPERKLSRVTNKKELEEYWTKALKNYPNLHFIPKQTIFQGNLCIFEYYAILDGKNKISVIEKFEFQDYGLVKKSSGFYGAEEPI
jgi:ketosteroid isomerase-like protein